MAEIIKDFRLQYIYNRKRFTKYKMGFENFIHIHIGGVFLISSKCEMFFSLVTFGSNSLFITVELTFNYVLDRVNVTIKSNNTKIMFSKVVQRFESDFPTFFNFVSLDNAMWVYILFDRAYLFCHALKMFYFTVANR